VCFVLLFGRLDGEELSFLNKPQLLLLSMSEDDLRMHVDGGAELMAEELLVSCRLPLLMLLLGVCVAALQVLEDMAVCMSKCASDVANRTGVMSGVSWEPDGVSLISLIHRKQS